MPPQQDGIESELEKKASNSSSASKHDLEKDEFKYFEAFQESDIVRRLLESENYLFDGKMKRVPYDGAYFGWDMGAVTPLFPELRRGNMVSNTWSTRANISTERGVLFNATFYNPSLVNVHYGVWSERNRQTLFKIGASKEKITEEEVNVPDKDKRFSLRELSFFVEVDGKPFLFSFQYGKAIGWRNDGFKEYLSLRISEKDKNDRFQVRMMINNVPSEVMKIEEFKEISENSKVVVTKTITQKQEEKKKRQEEMMRRFNR